jgi:hypothetical protein
MGPKERLYGPLHIATIQISELVLFQGLPDSVRLGLVVETSSFVR